jgi:hypothetical protein
VDPNDQHFGSMIEPVLAPHAASKDVAIAVDARESTVIALPAGWFQGAIAYLNALAECASLGDLRTRTPDVYLPTVDAWVERVEDGEIERRQSTDAEDQSLLPPGGLRFLAQRARLRSERGPELAVPITPETGLEDLAFDRFIEDYENLVLPPAMVQAGWLPKTILERFATLSVGGDGAFAHIKTDERVALEQAMRRAGFVVQDGQQAWERIVLLLERVAARFTGPR